MTEREPWFDAPLGSEANPLTVYDLPFVVPEAGRYWLTVNGQMQHLPEAPKGSVLALETRSA